MEGIRLETKVLFCGNLRIILAIFCNSKETQKHTDSVEHWWKEYDSKPKYCVMVIYFTDDLSNIL